MARVGSIAGWLGYGPQPLVGVYFCDTAVAAVVVEPERRRLLAAVEIELATGVVIAGRVEQPAPLAEAVGAAVGSVGGRDRRAVGLCGPLTCAGLSRVGRLLARAGVEPATVEPFAATAARLADLALDERRPSMPARPATPVATSVVARSGWLDVVIERDAAGSTTRVTDRAQHLAGLDLRRGNAATADDDPGGPLSPILIPGRLKPPSSLAVVAAGAAMAIAGPTTSWTAASTTPPRTGTGTARSQTGPSPNTDLETISCN